MLAPKKVKFRKSHKGRIAGVTFTGSELEFGDYALQAMEGGKLESRQLEASRVALTRHMKRGGKVWIRVFPDKPISKKAAETRMGSGKGGLDKWICPVRCGRIIFELEGVTADIAEKACDLAASKLPFKARFIKRSNNIWRV